MSDQVHRVPRPSPESRVPPSAADLEDFAWIWSQLIASLRQRAGDAAAEDAAADAVSAVLVVNEGALPARSQLPWLVRVALNRLRNLFKRLKPTASDNLELHVDAQSLRAEESRSIRESLMRVHGKLQPCDRETLKLLELVGTVAGIAEIRQVTERAVHQSLERIRAEVARELNRE